MLEVLSLIALGVGYMVFVSAAKEKKNVKFLGQGIGVLIMVASVMAMLCSSMMHAYKYGCPFSSKSRCQKTDKAMCPFMKQ